MDERELIEFIRKLSASGDAADPRWIETGPGDDAAHVRLPGGAGVVLSVDMVIEGVHFLSGAPADEVAGKAVGRALSDLAAMAARPLCSLAAICFPPDLPEPYHEMLCAGLFRHSAAFGAPLAGGDISSGSSELLITVTVVGVEGAGGPVGRGGALPGDAVCVSGALGGSLLGRHMTPQPRIEHALELAASRDLHAMIDISDGLSTDLLHLADESGVGIHLFASAVPIHPDAVEMARQEGGGEQGALEHALNDGEDYELLFCLPESQANELASTGIRGVNVSIIGRVVESPERMLIAPDGQSTMLEDAGWRHLKNR